jgi:hypothetical protein
VGDGGHGQIPPRGHGGTETHGERWVIRTAAAITGSWASAGLSAGMLSEPEIADASTVGIRWCSHSRSQTRSRARSALTPSGLPR